jgi:hypothetical protein
VSDCDGLGGSSINIVNTFLSHALGVRLTPYFFVGLLAKFGLAKTPTRVGPGTEGICCFPYPARPELFPEITLDLQIFALTAKLVEPQAPPRA